MLIMMMIIATRMMTTRASERKRVTMRYRRAIVDSIHRQSTTNTIDNDDTSTPLPLYKPYRLRALPHCGYRLLLMKEEARSSKK